MSTNYLLNFFFDFFFNFNFGLDPLWHVFSLQILLQSVDGDKFIIFLYKNIENNGIDFIFKLAFFIFRINADITKFLFLQITPVTFWMLPAVLSLLIGIFTFLLLDISSPNIGVYKFTFCFFKIIFFYQFCLIFMYVIFMRYGLFLKVGLNGFYNIPVSLDLVKLFCIYFCCFLLIITLLVCDYYFSLTRNIIKPEVYSIICFLEFSLNMVFLQSDLFSIFLYMEMISFCIYAFLFVQKWTFSQLQILIWYVLLSMWATTFYVVGLTFFLSNKHNFLMSFNFLEIYDSTKTFDSTTFLTILFFIFYFLFKLGAGPFYVWVLDVYTASSIIFLPIISIVPKLVYFPIAYFIFTCIFTNFLIQISLILFVFGFFTTAIGVVGIIGTIKLKEIYSWSSIIHTGNLLCLFSCNCVQWGFFFYFFFYLISYCITSLTFLLILMSIRNKQTGFFIKTLAELNYVNALKFPFYLPLVILFSVLTGFTPFVTFFMKFSVLLSVSQIFGILPTLFLGLLNILGSFAYLWLLRAAVGNNITLFAVWKELSIKKLLIIDIPYPIAVIIHLGLAYMIFGLFILLEMMDLLNFGFWNFEIDADFSYTIISIINS